MLSGGGLSFRFPPAPPTLALAAWLVVGFALFWLFAFTLVGLAGEMILFLAGLALLARGISRLVSG